jgi:CubicO group peptidase (beta-lactamase class C family)
MKKIVLFVFCLLVLPFQSVIAYGASTHDEEKIAQVDKYIKTEMKAAHIPDLSLGIVKGDQVLHLKGYGKKDASNGQVTPQTPFILGSTSKSFTAMAIMKLVEDGKVDLDSPIQTYLPKVKMSVKPIITVRQLLNQTSGIAKAPQQDEKWKINEANIGEVFEYSNENYRLLGQIISSVTNQSYGEYVKETIFAPLEMKHSYTSQKLAEENGLAAGYRTWFGVNRINQLPYQEEYISAGYIISSAEDMAHYLIAQLNGGSFHEHSLISSSSIEEMHKPAVKAPIMGEHSYYGMGWFHSPTNGTPTTKHSGEVPNYHSTMIIMPNENYGMILLANINNSILISGLIEKIGAGVVDILAGKQPETISSFTYYQTYLIMDGIVLIIVVMLVFHIKNIRKWHSGLSSRKLYKSLIVPIIVNFTLPILLLTQPPKQLGFTWSFLLDFVPDAASTLITVAVLLLLVGILKLYLSASFFVQRDRGTGTLTRV